MLHLECTPSCGAAHVIIFMLEELGWDYAVHIRPDGYFTRSVGRMGPRLRDASTGEALLGGHAIIARLFERAAAEGSALSPLSDDDRQRFEAFASPQLIIEPFLRLMRATSEPERHAASTELYEGLDRLERHLSSSPTITGRFSLADCTFAALNRIDERVDLGGWPAVKAYAALISGRPSYQQSERRLAVARAEHARPQPPEEVLRYWFEGIDLSPSCTEDTLFRAVFAWFGAGASRDEEVIARFSSTIEAALSGGLRDWEDDPRSCLALIVVLDQFTRHCYRDTPRMYDGDSRAQALALLALRRGDLEQLSVAERIFALMPLHHAEDVELQALHRREVAALAEAAHGTLSLLATMHEEQADKYNEIIGRFGRFPHRNAVLGRTSSPEEGRFLRTLRRIPPRWFAERQQQAALG